MKQYSKYAKTDHVKGTKADSQQLREGKKYKIKYTLNFRLLFKLFTSCKKEEQLWELQQ